jgi:hypothetical protein
LSLVEERERRVGFVEIGEGSCKKKEGDVNTKV